MKPPKVPLAVYFSAPGFRHVTLLPNTVPPHIIHYDMPGAYYSGEEEHVCPDHLVSYLTTACPRTSGAPYPMLVKLLACGLCRGWKCAAPKDDVLVVTQTISQLETPRRYPPARYGGKLGALIWYPWKPPHFSQPRRGRWGNISDTWSVPERCLVTHQVLRGPTAITRRWPPPQSKGGWQKHFCHISKFRNVLNLLPAVRSNQFETF